MLSSKQAGLLRKIILRDTLIEEKISLDKRLLVDFYRSRGFADFKINDVSTELSEEKDGFFINYNITEGPKFTFHHSRSFGAFYSLIIWSKRLLIRSFIKETSPSIKIALHLFISKLVKEEKKQSGTPLLYFLSP